MFHNTNFNNERAETLNAYVCNDSFVLLSLTDLSHGGPSTRDKLTLGDI